MDTILHRLLLTTVFCTGSASLVAAEFRLGSPFADHMVLQREKPLAVWGWADPGDRVTVSFAGQTKTATADADGRWSLVLGPLPASAESRTLTASDGRGHTIDVRDVLVGEVWLGSGQSNMAMTVAGCRNVDAEKAAATFPLIRHYREASGPAERPQAEGRGDWQACSPDTVGGFSAVLYFFGREIHTQLGVPVGLVNTSVGGTAIESWIPAEVQCSDPATKASYDSRLRDYVTFDPAQSSALHEQQLARWKAAAAKAKAAGTPFVVRPPKNPLAMHRLKGGPAGLFNGKVFNLAPCTLRGMLWYQGEGNAGRGSDLYQTQLTQLVTSWRALWHEELPFAWVQLPGYTAAGEGWPRVREAMLKTLAVPKTGMAITIDLGDAKDIHPKNKQDVGRRLALWALGSVYGKAVPAVSGPLPTGSTVGGGAITVSFAHANGGLTSMTGGPLTGFEIAAADRQWHPAEARIVGETVVISSPAVTQPVAVRYAWKDWPAYSLANAAGLPATPFRTDDWPAPSKETPVKR